MENAEELLDLNIALDDVDTSMPRLESGSYHLGIKDAKIETSKQGQGKRNLHVTFVTKQEANSTAGDALKPGFQVHRYYPLQQSDKENAPDFRRDISILIDAAYKTEASTRPALNRETIAGMVGRDLVASIKVKDDEQYGQVNEVGMLKAIDA